MKARTIAGNAATAALALLLLGPVGTADAQERTGTITGVVTDAAGGQTLESALVRLDSAEAGVLTNPQGRFTMTGVAAGEHTLTVTVLGYEIQQVQVTVVAGETATVNIELTGAALRLQNLEVTGVARAAARVKLPFTVGRPYNTESYAEINENEFKTVGDAPLSTFSIDVDRASYANVRRFIQDGQRPPADAVRIEEMINYFPYQWGDVAGEHPFAVTTEVTQAPWKPEHRLVRIGLHAESIDTENLPPSNLVFLLDVSGSMSSQDKLPLLKTAFTLLVDQVREQDRVAIVVYAGAAGLVLPSTPGSEKDEILAALEKLEAGGSTAGGAGIKLAYDVARKNHIDGGNNRVILATDGDFNVGASSDEAMVKLIEKERESGTFLTVLGFGTGNLKDSKMEQIADHGNGNFAYIDGLLEARKVLVEEMGGTLLTLAKDVKLQIEFNPARVAGYRLIGYENRLLADEDFNDDTKDAGELGAGHTVTALYEVVPAGVGMPGGSVDPLRYQDRPDPPEPTIAPSGFADEMMYVKVRYKDPDGDRSTLLEHPVLDRVGQPSADFRFATAVAGFGMLLRDSEHAGALTLDDIVSLAEAGRGDDPRGYRGEFIRLVETARDIKLLEMEELEFRGWRRR